MKTLFRIFLLSLLVLLAACEEEVSGAFLPVPDANGYVTCSMELNGGVVAYEGATRSSNGYEWHDGDRLYIRFATDNDTVLGYANYDGNKAEWQVSYAGSLKSGVTKGCEVYFFENATHKDNTTVELTVLSAIYQDTAAVYRFESNTVLLNATLHPKTGRVRFVSQNRDEFSLAGIRYYIGFDLSNKEFDVNYRRRLVLNAHKQQDNGEYSTDYLYGFYEENYDGSVRKEVPLGLDIINHADTSRVYHKDFALEMLNAGNSGYITLPSESTNQGWSVDKFNGGRYFAKWKYRGPEMYADGGILYGVLLNGNVIFDYDDSWYYCWGDRDSDGDYLTDGEYYTGTGSISKTKYDLAYAWYNDFGGYMPAKTAVSQMLSLNKYSNFCLVSDDFNVLALGSTYGYEDLDSSEDYDVESKYLWTASAISSTNAYAAVFAENGYQVKSMHKKYGMGFLITFDKELANNNNDHRSYNGINNGYEYADLGLPSGTKWATCNVGATKPEENGSYYAWGETEEKENYDWSTYKWCNGSDRPMTKYCTNSIYGNGDNKTVLDPEDDVAHINWGSSWRMPTNEELDELSSNCTFEWSVLNGVDCYKVTSKKNGNSIFLPVAGYFNGTEFENGGIGGAFWTSSLRINTEECACGYTYDKSTTSLDWGIYWGGYRRCTGRSVRPVCGDEKTCQITVLSSGNGTAAIKGRDKTSFAFIVGSTVTVVATPNDGYAFYGWFVEGTDSPVSTDSEYSFNLSENISLVAKFVVTGCVAVDLGLPSGTKWASFNVGATRPEEYGGYYAWGETEEKEDYSGETYKWCEGSSTTMTKYCTDGKYGTVDGKTVLDPEDDVAHVKWGGDWRMPTVEENVELTENCDCEMTTLNGVVGYVITSRVNGNSIFLPAAGFRRVDELDRVGDAYYWLNSLSSTNNDYAYMLYPAYFNDNMMYAREYGQSVRPVCGNAVEAPVAEYTVSVGSEENGHAMIKGRSGSSVTVGASSIVTVAATPDEGYRLEGWYVEGTDSLVSSKTEYSFTVNGDVALVAKFDVLVYEAVDLGLPSGIKWATFNVGATRPEEYGCYYAWGETEEKDNYVWSTYKWCEGRDSTITKYCTDSSYGRVDGKAMLDPEDDVAHVKWGGEWRMPTYGEQQELMDNCDWEWIQLNDVNGYKVTSKSNGNSIFLPAAGWSARYEVGTNGYYWSASVKSYGVYAMNTNIDSCGLNGYSRNVGLPIRPVCGEVAAPVEKYTVTVSSEGGGNVAIKDANGATVKFEAGVSVTVVATPGEGYVFEGWYVGSSETPVSTSAEYTFTVSEDVALVAKFNLLVYEAVDLGLPSGIKWATFNVGATRPEEYGGYYAWGETEEKENYDWSTYKWCNGSYNTMTKYCTNSSYGTVDNKTTLDLEDDVAHVKWGDSWRMPTSKEQQELLDNCTWTWTTQNGVNGYKVTSKSNGNSIFLPAAGYRSGITLYAKNSEGHIWSSLLYTKDGSHYANTLRFFSGISYACNSFNRNFGLSVRPVCGEWVKYTVTVGSAGNGNVAVKDVDGTSTTIEIGSAVTVVATPDEGYSFSGWYTGNSETPVSTDAEYTFTVIEDVALVARFEVNEPGSANGDYYVKYGADVMVGSLRYPRSVGIVGAQSPQQQLNDIASASSHAAYFDKTSTVFEVKSGETVTPTILYTGNWMHGYVFVDWDNSKQFEVNLEGDGPFTKGEGNELMCWSFYGKDGEDIGWNSAGASLRKSDSYSSVAPGSFRVPDGLVTGSTYRMRFAIMWNCIDPSGDYADFIDDGGSIIDVTLKIIGDADDEIIGDADDETDPSPFDSDKLYTISSQRAFLLYQPSTNALVASTGTAVNAVQNPQDPNQQFQIKRNSSGYQLYSVGAGGYAVYQSIFNVQFDSNAGSKLTITETGNSAYPWKLLLGDYYLNAQDEGQCSTGLRVDTWSYTDAGNSYILEEVVPPVTHIVSVSSEGNGSVAISGNSGTSATFETGASVTVVATPDEGYAFSGWYVGGNALSTHAEYTLTVSEDVELLAKFTKIMNEINGHEYVDLGLPSGIKWATCNVGATTPAEYGGYYAWGETEEKEDYSWETYKWCNGSSTTMTKYCTDGSYGIVDDKTVLDPEDDVAHVKWGGSWRMPTRAEQEELLDNCTWTWATLNGVICYKVTSMTNGNSIFLPAAGYRPGTEVNYRGSNGYYWSSSSLDSSYSGKACYLYFSSGSHYWSVYGRYRGQSVRPVSE